jgi:hypothetical protein
VLALFVHRLHHGTNDPGKDCTTARAPKRISEETAQGPGGSRIGTSSSPKEATKKGSSSDTADRTTNDLGQLTHRHLLQDRAYRLAADNASNDLNYNRKYRFHFGFPTFNARRGRQHRPVRCDSVKLKDTLSTVHNGSSLYLANLGTWALLDH